MSARFRLEARLLAGIHHPGLVDIVDFGAAGGRFYLTMPLLRGRTLRERARDASMTWREAVAIAVAVLDGLGAAHGAGVVHRDVKPDNIFLCDDGVTKVIDFGVAKVEDRSIVTEPGLVVGTPAYMSPEQVTGSEVDARSDVYSVGVVLYELLAGRRPFPGENPEIVAAMRIRRDPRSLMLAAPTLPIDLSTAVDCALTHAVERRHQTAYDFELALRACLAFDSVRAPDTRLPRPAAPVSRMAPTRTVHNEAVPLPHDDESTATRADASRSHVEPKSIERTAGARKHTSPTTDRRSARKMVEPVALEFIAWDDIFVLVNHGRASAAEYGSLGERVLAAAAKYPAGIGGLVIVPRRATPPSEAARRAMNGMQEQLSTKLRGLCWTVEGKGFQGAMARAVLTGLKLLADFPYPSYVTTSVEDALAWLVRIVDGDDHRIRHIADGSRWIADARRASVPTGEISRVP